MSFSWKRVALMAAAMTGLSGKAVAGAAGSAGTHRDLGVSNWKFLVE
jgi:hypothetical protein